MRKKTNYRNGFTLIEMLVAVSVFTIIVSMAAGVFVFSLKAQRKGLATQELLDQVSYAAEYMSRAIRMAQKDLTGACLVTAGAKNNYEIGTTPSRIRFLNYLSKCQEFSLDSGRLKERKSTDSSATNFQASQDLTSSSLNVRLFGIVPNGTGQNDDLQPRITFILDVQGKENSIVKIQTTVSQRNADIQE